MSIRVTDPQGEMWVVSREWFAMPPGARHAVWDLPSLPDADIDAPLEDLGGLAVVVAVVTLS